MPLYNVRLLDYDLPPITTMLTPYLGHPQEGRSPGAAREVWLSYSRFIHTTLD